MQGDLLSSSYCVRLGRLRFRMEYKATGREAEGARGRQHTEEVSTHTLLGKDPRTGAGWGRDLAAHMQTEGGSGCLTVS